MSTYFGENLSEGIAGGFPRKISAHDFGGDNAYKDNAKKNNACKNEKKNATDAYNADRVVHRIRRRFRGR